MSNRRFAVCIDNRGHGASLELRKLYEVLPDADALKHGQLRVVEESGGDYLYEAAAFDLVTPLAKANSAALWLDQAERHAAEIDSGAVQLVSSDEVSRQACELLTTHAAAVRGLLRHRESMRDVGVIVARDEARQWVDTGRA